MSCSNLTIRNILTMSTNMCNIPLHNQSTIHIHTLNRQLSNILTTNPMSIITIYNNIKQLLEINFKQNNVNILFIICEQIARGVMTKLVYPWPPCIEWSKWTRIIFIIYGQLCPTNGHFRYVWIIRTITVLFEWYCIQLSCFYSGMEILISKKKIIICIFCSLVRFIEEYDFKIIVSYNIIYKS